MTWTVFILCSCSILQWIKENEDLCTTTRSVKREICRKQNSNIQKIHLSLRHADPGAKTADEPWFKQYMIWIYYFKKHTHLFNIWHLFTLEFSSISLLCIPRCDLHSRQSWNHFWVESLWSRVWMMLVWHLWKWRRRAEAQETKGERQLSINFQLILNKLGKLNIEQCEETNKQTNK